jgi:acyl-CoA thioester hydrolase
LLRACYEIKHVINMTDEKKTSSPRRAPRKRSRSKRPLGNPDAARSPDAAQRNPGPSKDASQSGAPEPTGNQRAKTAPEPAPGGKPGTSNVLAVIPLHVRWRDLDAFNHVNNSSYLTFLEEARLQWLRTVPGEWFGEHAMPVMAAVELHYRKPIAWPAEIDVRLSCERLGNTSLTIGNRIVDRNDANCVYADGNIVMVWIDPASGAAVPLPDAIRGACFSS